ncbi:MAG TPA: alpha/beta hydrolase [Frateuria sp.]|uniref:alpha/beta fold hydrolase n=1 Tax=Frateuria sp. TaxID=2211372 RepID=UPI002DE361C3|nr:alpha/beta hydrolase [Frateuria sp.]
MRNKLNRFIITACSLALVGLATQPARAAEAGTLQVGTLSAQKHGSHGQPVILIPGLSSGAWAWAQTVPGLAKNHVVYTVTLAGFDGTPAPGGGDYLAQAERSLVRLIGEQHLVKPVLVGHSLGGTLALKLASEQPQLLGAVVAVDGLPVLPMTENLPAAQRVAMAQAMKAQLAAATPAAFQAQQLGYMRSIGTIDPARAAQYAALSSRSDPKAVAEYAAEDLALDFRAQMKNATVPILEISPYYAADGKAAAQPYTEAQKTAYWKSLLGAAPHAAVASISPSRHFAMLDQPAQFQQTLDGFLNSL